MNKRKTIKELLTKLIKQGFFFMLLVLILSYLLYDRIEEYATLKQIVLAEIVLGMILVDMILVNSIFNDVFSFISKITFFISVIWSVSMCACLSLGLFMNASGFSELLENSEKTNDNGELYNFKTSRIQMELEKIDNSGSELPASDSSASWHLMTEDSYDPTGKLYELINYEYDDAGKIRRKIFYYTDGKIEKYEDYIYNKQDYLIKIEVYKKNDNDSDSKHSYIYDIYDMDNVVYEYDNRDYCTYERLLQNSRLGDYIAYTYDNDGSLIKKENITRGATEYSYEYNYDEKGKIKNIISTNISQGRIYNKSRTDYSYEYDSEGILKKQTEDHYIIYWYSGDWFAGTGQYMERDKPDSKTRRDIYIKYYDDNGNAEKEERWEVYYSNENGTEEMKNELMYYKMYSYEYF